MKAKHFPRLYAPSGGYVFVITYGRSGSTLVQNLLNGIDGYCIRGENNSTLRPIAEAWSVMSAMRRMSGIPKVGARTEVTHPWYGVELTQPNRFAHSMGNLFVREILRLPADTRVGGFKEIRYTMPRPDFNLLMKFILTVFPNPRFVFNTRDHAAVSQSGWWADKDPAQVMRQLRDAEAIWDDFVARHPKNCLKLRYDDYVGNPEAFDPLYDFLGERRDRALSERVLATRLTHLK